MVTFEIKGPLLQYSVYGVLHKLEEIWFDDCAHGFDIYSIISVCECIVIKVVIQGVCTSSLLICDQQPSVLVCVFDC